MAQIIESLVPTAGYQSRVLRAGAGNERAVLLLHGGGPGAGARANFDRTLAELGEEFDVIAPDLVGFGGTDHPDPPVFGPQAWQELRIRQIEALLDAYEHERATFVGNSLGGALTLSFVLAHPQRVEKMVLMGSAGAPFEAGPELRALLSFYDDPSADNLRSVLKSFVYDLDRFGDIESLIEGRLEAALQPAIRRSFEAMFRSEDGQPVRGLALPEEAVRNIEHEALIVHGRDDRIMPLDASLWLLDRLPNADLYVLGRCGHWAMIERADTFNHLVLEFIFGRLGLDSTKRSTISG
jgi:2-hydroxymuconate-semialdehyde hydrolase